MRAPAGFVALFYKAINLSEPAMKAFAFIPL